MPITKADLANAKQDEDKRKAEANQAKLKAEEKKANEAPRKAASDAITSIRDKLNFKRGGTVKTKRYAAGGETDDEAKQSIVTKFGKSPGGEDTFERDREVKVSESGPSSFKEAFASARSAGDKMFEYNGKKYTTETAAAKKPAPKAEPAEPKESRGMGPKNTFLTKERMGVKDKSEGSWMERAKEHLGNEFKTKKMAKGGSVSSASSRGDGIAQRGKTKGKIY